MSSKRLSYTEAAIAIAGVDPLEDVKITLGLARGAAGGYPKLSLSAKSVVNYKAKAKHLGTVFGDMGQAHYMMLQRLADAMRAAELHPGEEVKR